MVEVDKSKMPEIPFNLQYELKKNQGETTKQFLTTGVPTIVAELVRQMVLSPDVRVRERITAQIKACLEFIRGDTKHPEVAAEPDDKKKRRNSLLTGSIGE